MRPLGRAKRGRRWCGAESLEGRWLLTTPVVTAVTRAAPSAAITAASSVAYAVSFNTSVNGVDATDFSVSTTGSAQAGTPVVVSGGPTNYTVTVNRIHGSGDLRLDLIDNDSIKSQNTATSLAGPGVGNGSFQGQVYTILQAGPRVVSINRSSAAGPTTSYAVSFDQPVTGVDSTDFATVGTGTVNVGSVQVSGGGASYTITLGGITGSGTVGLNVVDNGSIRDLAGNPLQGGTAPLAPQATYDSGQNPRAVAVADLNGDGRPDLIAANCYYGPYANCVSVLLSNGGGTFQNPATFSITTPYALTTADLNGDGKADLVVTSRSGTVSELLGNGNGSFQLAVPLAGVTGAFVASADVNGDGKADVIATDGGSVVSVLLGNGDGNFKTPATFATGQYNRGLSTADVNGDGKPDLLVANFFNGAGGNSVSVLLGNGNGTFKAQATFATGTSPVSVAAADFNGDGKLDLAVADQRGHAISVMMGNGNGTFAAQTTYLATRPAWVTTADMNGDGNVDILYCDYSTNSVGVILGGGNGAFQTRVLSNVGGTPFGVAVGDLNGDGKTDVISANYADGSVSVLLGGFNGNSTGQVSTINPSSTITGTAGADAITLALDAGHGYVDWTVGTASGFVAVNDANGLTIDGGGGNDVITLDYSNGNPLPNTLHLNGTFTVNGLPAVNPLAGTTVEMAKSTLWITYNGASPAAGIRAALAAGWNGGAWNGSSGGGVITSSAAAGNSNHNTGIGWADSGDGTGVNTVANSVELKYTLNGDANLNGVVDIFDLNALLPHYNGSGGWTGGDSTYNGQVDIFDLNALLPNYNTSLGSQVTSAASASVSVMSAALARSETAAELVNAGAAGTSGGGFGAEGDFRDSRIWHKRKGNVIRGNTDGVRTL